MGRETVTRIQGAYYLVTGLWPILHFDSFEALTGPKRDRWLVRTIGLLAAVIGVTLLRRPREARLLGDLSALAFGVADVLAVRAGQLPSYLADTAVEAAFVGMRRRPPP